MRNSSNLLQQSAENLPQSVHKTNFVRQRLFGEFYSTMTKADKTVENTEYGRQKHVSIALPLVGPANDNFQSALSHT